VAVAVAVSFLEFSSPWRCCVVKPPLRTKSLGTKVSDGEYARLEALASARGQSISELIRSVLLSPDTRKCSACQGPLEEIASPNGHGHTTAEQMLLAEVVGLRTILLNLFFKLANGPMASGSRRRRCAASSSGPTAARLVPQVRGGVAHISRFSRCGIVSSMARVNLVP
jgi:hypothetical protein